MTAGRLVTRVTLGRPGGRRPDILATEEPLELRVQGVTIALTMRTPGADFDLVAGYLVSEGIVTRAEQLAAIRYCGTGGGGATSSGTGGGGASNAYNVVDVVLARGVTLPERAQRLGLTNSSCGICGRSSIEATVTRSPYDVRRDPLRLDPATLVALPDRLRSAQHIFDRTGGLHAAALFDGSTNQLLALREDVGRHNALDKVVGWALRGGLLPARGTVLMVSGRSSFELVQKALLAGIPALCAVSAPSSLAVDLAVDSGMTLVGFLRGQSFVIYAGAERVVGETATA